MSMPTMFVNICEQTHYAAQSLHYHSLNSLYARTVILQICYGNERLANIEFNEF